VPRDNHEKNRELCQSFEDDNSGGGHQHVQTRSGGGHVVEALLDCWIEGHARLALSTGVVGHRGQQARKDVSRDRSPAYYWKAKLLGRQARNNLQTIGVHQPTRTMLTGIESWH